METDSLLDDIQDINLSYLLLAQRMISEDRTTALFRLKMDDEMADLISSLSIKQLTQLARTNQLLCRLCYEEPGQLYKLTHNQREQGLGQTHAALLMASAHHECSSVSSN
ncbi:flagellar transcriptional activator FlhD [Chromohalobacter marismortui]|uniref:Flagellar transcriptional regulator FlhD n=1 Tax=Chromohalobacter marismortui TaxID=42055 RepID=A0A4V3F3V9_9GAMM|nr:MULTISPECIES: flagellar transcriptional regulator FlhD [Chromohalobacter]MCI0508787.1 flagellar transcriptional regulator FlhD [Chromohalobacter sp.]TDU22846.1 flagellar transcriptional activator FlhD [Chromohalobacter marismortui]